MKLKECKLKKGLIQKAALKGKVFLYIPPIETQYDTKCKITAFKDRVVPRIELSSYLENVINKGYL